jgi:cobalamin biosynthesis protein CobD/CbiB
VGGVKGTGLSILFDPYANVGYVVTYWASLFLLTKSGFRLGCCEDKAFADTFIALHPVTFVCHALSLVKQIFSWHDQERSKLTLNGSLLLGLGARLGPLGAWPTVPAPDDG